MLDFPFWKRLLILCAMAYGLLYAAPNIVGGPWKLAGESGLSSWLPGQTVNLGLDLQGGAHLLLAVDLAAVDQELVDDQGHLVRQRLRENRIGYRDFKTTDQTLSLRLRDPLKRSAAQRTLQREDERWVLGGTGANLTITVPASLFQQRRESALRQSLEIIRRRVDELGSREPTIQQQGLDRIIVQVPGVKDPERLKETIGKTAKMTFHLTPASYPPGAPLPTRPPVGTRTVAYAQGPDDVGLVERQVRLSGESLIDAQATFQDNQPVVSFRLDTQGARRFGRLTTNNVGRNLAIVLDNEMISAPVLREPITGGSGVISGQFSVQEAQDLALLLRAGALPAPIKVLEERTVGPGLGADSVQAGLLASILSLALVGVYMLLVYGSFGSFAALALGMNIVLILALLSNIQATLTLPGIAGIVVTMGMAVDANVLIFERIREEARLNRSLFSAVEAGYRRALTTIIDSNLTTLIAALCLFLFGSGPIKGFAVTLAIGIVCSMFTAIMVTRWMIVLWLRRAKREAIPL